MVIIRKNKPITKAVVKKAAAKPALKQKKAVPAPVIKAKPILKEKPKTAHTAPVKEFLEAEITSAKPVIEKKPIIAEKKKEEKKEEPKEEKKAEPAKPKIEQKVVEKAPVKESAPQPTPPPISTAPLTILNPITEEKMVLITPKKEIINKRPAATDLKKDIESLLFSSGKAMSEKDLCELTGSTPGAIKKALIELKADYDTRDTSLVLIQTNDAWKLNVREKYIGLVTKIVADTELPFPLLETLSVIAYKAPIVQAEVIKIRGTNAYEHIGLLLEAGFVEKRKSGRSFKIGLTNKFFDYFDVEGEHSIKQLLKDVKPAEKKKLGNLDVVDVLPGTKQEDEKKELKDKLGDFEIVDTKEEAKETEEDEPKKGEIFRPDDDFLKKIDDQIDTLAKRNDEHDDDDLFKKKEEPAEGEQLSKTDEIFGEREPKKVTAEDAYPDDENEGDAKVTDKDIAEENEEEDENEDSGTEEEN